MIAIYRVHNRLRITAVLITAILVLVIEPLFSQSVRSSNQTYFNSIQWEESVPFYNTGLPEPFRIENQSPIPYGDIASEQAVYPSLAPLGKLDYQNIDEDMLVFLDGAASAFSAKKIDSSLCLPEKSFLPYLFAFLMTNTPDTASVFYGRPVFKNDGSTITDFKIIFKKQAKNLESGTSDAEAESFPLSYLAAVEAVKKENIWYVSGISIKATEYQKTGHEE